MNRPIASFPHLVQRRKEDPHEYQSVLSVGRKRRRLNREEHAPILERELTLALEAGLRFIGEHQRDISFAENGVYLRFVTRDYHPTDYESRDLGIRVLAVRTRWETTDDAPPRRRRLYDVTVFVPRTALQYFHQRIEEYRSGPLTEKNNPPHAGQIESIESIEAADALTALWTDPPEQYDESSQSMWWEVWVPHDQDLNFLAALRRAGGRRVRSLMLPFHMVRLIQASEEQLRTVVRNTGAIAELRAPRRWPSEIFRSSAVEGPQINAFAGRIAHRPSGVMVALFDTGVSHSHPLLSPAISPERVFTYHDSFGKDDDWGHGTPMAGLVLHGDLAEHLRHSDPMVVSSSLESVKVLPHYGAAAPGPLLYGEVYRDAVDLVETSSPTSRRVFCCAINDPDPFAGMLPSEWSAEIDKLAYFGRRLFLVSAGNATNVPMYPLNAYPGFNDAQPLANPGQAWNALTIGGYTELVNYDEALHPNHTVIAPRGALAPQSRTAAMFDAQWPIKPDVVFEAGNFAFGPADTHARPIEDLMLVSTGADVTSEPLVSFGYTSGATALASNFVASILTRLPNVAPETVRGLVVHSADWTEVMKAQLPKAGVAEKLRLVRRYGHGVPELRRAISSSYDDATIIIEDHLRPVEVGHDKPEQLGYDLAWPERILAALDDVPVRIRITLSYFVLPYASRRGFRDRYRYQSHGLRFEMRRNYLDDVDARINELAHAAEEDDGVEDDDPSDVMAGGWVLGPKVRDRGSVISDEWHGMARDAAQMGRIVVYPVGGWLRDAAADLRKKYEDVRFSLLVNLRVDATQTVDIYSFLAAQLQEVVTIAV